MRTTKRVFCPTCQPQYFKEQYLFQSFLLQKMCITKLRMLFILFLMHLNENNLTQKQKGAIKVKSLYILFCVAKNVLTFLLIQQYNIIAISCITIKLSDSLSVCKDITQLYKYQVCTVLHHSVPQLDTSYIINYISNKMKEYFSFLQQLHVIRRKYRVINFIAISFIPI